MECLWNLIQWIIVLCVEKNKYIPHLCGLKKNSNKYIAQLAELQTFIPKIRGSNKALAGQEILWPKSALHRCIKRSRHLCPKRSNNNGSGINKKSNMQGKAFFSTLASPFLCWNFKDFGDIVRLLSCLKAPLNVFIWIMANCKSKFTFFIYKIQRLIVLTRSNHNFFPELHFIAKICFKQRNNVQKTNKFRHR